MKDLFIYKYILSLDHQMKKLYSFLHVVVVFNKLTAIILLKILLTIDFNIIKVYI